MRTGQVCTVQFICNTFAFSNSKLQQIKHEAESNNSLVQTFDENPEASFSFENGSHALPLAVEGINLEEPFLGIFLTDSFIVLSEFTSKLEQRTFRFVTKMFGELTYLC